MRLPVAVTDENDNVCESFRYDFDDTPSIGETFTIKNHIYTVRMVSNHKHLYVFVTKQEISQDEIATEHLSSESAT